MLHLVTVTDLASLRALMKAPVHARSPPVQVPLQSASRQVQHGRCCQYVMTRKVSMSLSLGLRAALSIT